MAWQFAPGEFVTATNLNAVTLPWNAVCQLSLVTPQSITDNTVTVVVFDTDTTGVEDLDPRGWHENTTNPNRVTPNIAGWYSAHYALEWQSDADYVRVFGEVRKNGASLGLPRRLEAPTVTTPNHYTGGTLIQMNGSTDWLELTVFQDNTSGNANNCDVLFTVKLEYPT